MAFSEALAGRVRHLLARRKHVEEKRMFSGLGFLLNGNLLVGVRKDSLLVRLGPEQGDEALKEPHVSDKVKAGLRKAQGLRREWARAQREIGEQQRQLQAVAEDQARLRANLREVPQSSPLHRRYLDKLGRQGDEVEKHRADIQKLQGQGTPGGRRWMTSPPPSPPTERRRPAAWKNSGGQPQVGQVA
jgi:TfoX/Sxy family transcriptional regulator of competence genes